MAKIGKMSLKTGNVRLYTVAFLENHIYQGQRYLPNEWWWKLKSNWIRCGYLKGTG
jgi:hypothetical protein